MNTKEKIQSFRKLMKENQINTYVIPSSDDHASEYVGEYFKARAFMSGFTGSAGTLVITEHEAGLWTDGRYFIQAEKELEGSEIKLFRAGEPGVPTVDDYVCEQTPSGGILGFNGKVIGARQGIELEEKLLKKDVKIVYQEDLVDKLWEERPSLPNAQAFLLDIKYCGKSFADKLKDLRQTMKEKQVTTHIMTTLDDIAWLFNLRGGDVAYNPVVLAYAMITLEKVILFVDENKLNASIKKQFKADGIELQPYANIYKEVMCINGGETVLLDPSKVNYMIYKSLSCDIEKREEPNPVMYCKAVKNEVELESIRKSHIKDGIAFTKFMYWLKNNVSKQNITEIEASEKLESLRREQEGFIEPSFGTISAYKDHGAMMHYSATPNTQYTLESEGLFLIDSGGQYYEGTTDITRTMALGPITNEMKQHFTAVVRGMINLSRARFLEGVRGVNLDILARGPIWDLNLDYRCGTGHGVGFLLNVHEGPNGFRWKIVPERNDSCVLEEGMVTTNEPGIYIENSHGIRIENELVVQKGEKSEYGQYLYFETVTFAPIDLDALDITQMNEHEKSWLNHYHKEVYDKISPYLEKDEKEWLKKYTREI